MIFHKTKNNARRNAERRIRVRLEYGNECSEIQRFADLNTFSVVECDTTARIFVTQRKHSLV